MKNKNDINKKESLQELANLYSEELECIARRQGIPFVRFNIDNIDDNDLTEEEKSTLYREFIEWLNINNLIHIDRPDDDLSEESSLEEFITNFYGDIDQLQSHLQQFQAKNQSQKSKTYINNIITHIEHILIPAKRRKILITQPILLNYNLSSATSEKIEKLYDLSDRATFYYQLSHGYSAEDTSSKNGLISEKTNNMFSKLSMDQLVAKFAPKEFYKLSAEEVKALVAATSQRYCIDNHIPPCSVSFSKLNTSTDRVTLGAYSWANQNIRLNSNILNQLDAFKASNNKYLPYELLQVIIHESQHRVQHGNLDKIALDTKDNLVKNAIMNTNGDYSNSFIAYQSALEEQDARNAALSFIQNYASRSDDPSFRAFADLETTKELGSKKKQMTDKDTELFPALYHQYTLGSKYTEQSRILSQCHDFYSTLNREAASSYRESERTREYSRINTDDK